MSDEPRVPIRRALLSVSEKAGLGALGAALAAHGAALLSTGGTAAALRAEGLAVRDVGEASGFPEVFGGRVKTLTPAIHGGILFRRDDASDVAEAAAHGIAPIDLVVVNLYPFVATVAAGADDAACVERIDVGGPAMIRAAAKNFAHVAVASDPADYAALIASLAAGGTTLAERRAMAARAFARTAAYDAAIASWFDPSHRVISASRVQVLRYGENPHQAASLYDDGSGRPGVVGARQVQGKALSYNNLADADGALACVAEFEEPACVIVKHANPCGAAAGADAAAAWEAALAGDEISAFGGIVALNRALDEATATSIARIFTEVVIAPDATEAARAALAGKPSVRLLLTGGLPDPAAPGETLRSVAGGLLVQSADTGRIAAGDLRVVTARAPTDAERDALLFAWRVAKHVKSNAVVLASGAATVGIGAGQMSRLDAARIAVEKAAGRARGSVAASDAFFPFADGLQRLADAGVTAVIQPGGSMRDAEVIAAADRAGMAMVFTGMRHFRH